MEVGVGQVARATRGDTDQVVNARLVDVEEGFEDRSDQAGLNDPAAHARLETHPFALHIGAGIAKIIEDFRIAAKFHAGIAQNGVGVLLDQAEPFLAENIEGGDPAPDIGRPWTARRSRLSAGPAPTFP